jgi:uncharacterized membrane protein HdeD (DUF308 family)
MTTLDFDRRERELASAIYGLIAIGLGFWASGDFYRSAVLLVAYVALFALLRGSSSIVLAFTLRSAGKAARG